MMIKLALMQSALLFLGLLTCLLALWVFTNLRSSKGYLKFVITLMSINLL